MRRNCHTSFIIKVINKHMLVKNMILSNEDIKRCLANGTIKIDPEPGDDQIGPASVDLTLSNEFLKVKKEYVGKILDLENAAVGDITKKVSGEDIVLKHGDIILGKTVEKITLPKNLAGWIEGRSSFARLGTAIHITSGFIQPGSDNHQVLEMVNFAPFSVTLHAGMRICQVVFERMKSATSRPYSKFGKIAVDQ